MRRASPSSRARMLLAIAASAMLASCGRGGARVDPATTDRGAMRNGAAAVESVAPIRLANGTQVIATPAAQRLQAYLDSAEPAGARFDMPAVSFVGGTVVREDPSGALATIAAILQQHPQARIQIEVSLLNPGQPGSNAAAENRARAVAEALQRNGVAADRISSAGRKGLDEVPRVSLVVTGK